MQPWSYGGRLVILMFARPLAGDKMLASLIAGVIQGSIPRPMWWYLAWNQKEHIIQYDQIGRFFKVLETNSLMKVTQMYGDF